MNSVVYPVKSTEEGEGTIREQCGQYGLVVCTSSSTVGISSVGVEVSLGEQRDLNVQSSRGGTICEQYGLPVKSTEEGEGTICEQCGQYGLVVCTSSSVGVEVSVGEQRDLNVQSSRGVPSVNSVVYI